MDGRQWVIRVEWENEPWPERACSDTEELKAFLDREVFCLDHGCPLPVSVTIGRTQ